MNKITIIFIASMALLYGCADRNSKCIITNSKLLKDQAEKLFIIAVNNGQIQDISDKGIDSINEVGYYTFYDNGYLKSYKFFVTKKAYVYNEEYDKKGSLIKTEGKPLIFTKAKNISRDSTFFRLFFSTLNRNYDDLNVLVNGQKKFSVKLFDDNLHSNMETAAFGVNTKGLKELNLIVNITYKNNCSEKSGILRDTSSYERNP